MAPLIAILQQYPEPAIFLTLALGFFIGRLRFGNFSLGTVVGTRLAGVLIGQFDIKVSPTVKTAFIALFLFATGYKVDSQKKNAIPQFLLTVVTYVLSLITAIIAVPHISAAATDPVEESRKLDVELSGKEELEPGILSSYCEWDLRAYRVSLPTAAHRTCTEMGAS